MSSLAAGKSKCFYPPFFFVILSVFFGEGFSSHRMTRLFFRSVRNSMTLMKANGGFYDRIKRKH